MSDGPSTDPRHVDGGRDEGLGAALRALDVPDHGSAFHATLVARLRAEAAEAGDADVPPARRVGVVGRRAGRRRAAARRPLAWGVAAAVLVLGGILMTVSLPGTAPRQATAADVRAAVATAWAETRTISGELVIESADEGMYGRGTVGWGFVLTSNGDFRLTGITRDNDVAFASSRHVERSLDLTDPEFPIAGERRGVAPGRPDQGPSSTILDRSLGSVVRALVVSGRGEVREILYQNRRAWLLETDVRENLLDPQTSADHLQVTVDRESGLPVRVISFNDDRFKSELRLEDLQVNSPVPPERFELEFPPGVEVFRTDHGFREATVEEARGIVGYEPLVPGWIPEGYRLADVMVSRVPSPTGTEAGNPAVGDIVSLSYRRGLDQFIVTTRPMGGDPLAWDDPLATGEGFVDRPEKVTIRGGALDGVEAELMVDPLAVPHIWAIGEGLVVTVSDDLTEAELLAVAASLR
jgi:hypothetical protein